MPTPTAAIFDAASNFNVVEKYYSMFPHEVSNQNQPLFIAQIERVPKLTFEKLLDTMIEKSKMRFIHKDTFLIVAHGFHNSMDFAYGLTMPLTDHTTMKTAVDVLEPLLDFLNRGASESAMNDFEKNPNIIINNTKPTLPKGCVSRIVGKMKQLRDLKVRRVEFRACALGTNPHALEVIGQCFSARWVYAPDVHMFYAGVNPGHPVKDAALDQQLKTRQDARLFSDGSDRFALRVQGSGVARNTWASTTAKDLSWFTDQYIDKQSSYPRGTTNPASFVAAGMDLAGSKHYALPQEPEYAQHLIFRGPLPGNMI